MSAAATAVGPILEKNVGDPRPDAPGNDRTPVQRAASLPRAVGSDHAADAGGRRANDVCAALDGTQLRDLRVHVRPGGLSEPGVVGADYQKIRAFLHLRVGQIGKGRFPADKRRNRQRARLIDAVFPSRRQSAVERTDVGQPREKGSSGKPFGKRYELSLIIDRERAVGREYVQRVVERSGAARQAAGDDRRASACAPDS